MSAGEGMRVRKGDVVRSGTLISMPGLQNLTSLGVALIWTAEHFAEFGLPAAPIPKNVSSFPPGNLLVTDRSNIGTGERIGRILFFRDDGATLFDQEWTIAEPDR